MSFIKNSRKVLAVGFLLYLLFLGKGVSQYAKERQAIGNAEYIRMARLGTLGHSMLTENLKENRRFLLDGFSVVGDKPIVIGRYEYLQLHSGEALHLADPEFIGPVRTGPAFFLRRESSLPGSLVEYVDSRTDGGLNCQLIPMANRASYHQNLLRKHALTFDGHSGAVVSVDSNSLKEIVWFYGTLSIIVGVGFVVVVYSLAQENDKRRSRRERVRCEVAMQTAISRFDTLRQTP